MVHKSTTHLNLVGSSRGQDTRFSSLSHGFESRTDYKPVKVVQEGQECNEARCQVLKTPRSKSNLDARSHKVAHCRFESYPDFTVRIITE